MPDQDNAARKTIVRIRMPSDKARILSEAAALNGLSTSTYIKSLLFSHVARKLGMDVKKKADRIAEETI